MIARIISNQRIQLENITAWEEELIDKHFSAVNPHSAYIDNSAYQSWDGVYRRYHRKTQQLPRPFLSELRALCKEKDLQLVIRDDRPPSKYKLIPMDQIDENFLPGIELKPFQIDAIKTIWRAEVGLFDISTGGGKCLGENTPVMMYDGSIKFVQDIRPGDLLMGDDSGPRRVKSICSGDDELYKIEQLYGDDYIVNSSHMLSLRLSPHHCGHEPTYVDISVSEYLQSNNFFKHRAKGYKAAVEYQSQPVPFDPYILGIWLGDGITVDLQFSLSEVDDRPIIEYLDLYCKSNGLVLVKYPDDRENSDIYAMRLYQGNSRPEDIEAFTKNPLKSEFKRLGLFGHKHIPLEFKFSSRLDRLKLLAGLIDSDGYTNERNDTLYLTIKYNDIVPGVLHLARSLGFRATVNPTWKKWEKRGDGAYYARITISGDLDQIPIRIPYKKCVARSIKKHPLAYAISVKPIGRGKYYGFELDGNKRFLLGDFTVTHNTEVMAGICKSLACPTVILADMRQVVDQICARLALRQVCTDPGLFYAGKTPQGQLVLIGTVQSLVVGKKPEKPERDKFKDTRSSSAEHKYKAAIDRFEKSLKAYNTRSRRAGVIRDLIGKCEMIIVDEADLAVSSTYKNLFRYWFKGRRRYGLTGTPFDDAKPVARLILQEHLGSVIYKQSRDDVEKAGLTVPLDYRMIAIGDYSQKDDARAYDIAVDEEMVYNEDFHRRIADICAQNRDKGTLVLVDRDDLGNALMEIIPDCGFVHGKTPKKRRSDILRAFERRELKVLIGGKNVRRGLDLSGGCETLILATGGKLTSEFDQRLGRARRRNADGIATVYDFFFLCNKYLYDHSRKRLKAAAAMGYPVSVIYQDGIVDGRDLIRSRFHKPRFSKR